MFEEFLREKHAENYIGTDDDMPDAYENWLSGLDTNDVIDMGNEFAKTLVTTKPK